MMPDWKDQTAIIIGGGASLKGYNFAKLAGRNVIGINEAFRLGSQVVKICLFGDGTWFQRVKWDLERYGEHGGKVAAVTPKTAAWKLPWLTFLKRESQGIHYPPSCGWNQNTGAAAVNFAANLGVNRIFLLGYDMNSKGVRTHWHNQYPHKTQMASFNGFLKGFARVAEGMRAKYPHVAIFNVTDGTSRLDLFPKLTFEQFDQFLEHGQTPPILAIR